MPSVVFVLSVSWCGIARGRRGMRVIGKCATSFGKKGKENRKKEGEKKELGAVRSRKDGKL